MDSSPPRPFPDNESLERAGAGGPRVLAVDDLSAAGPAAATVARFDDVDTSSAQDDIVRVAEFDAVDRQGARVVDLVAPVRSAAPRVVDLAAGGARTGVADFAGARSRSRRSEGSGSQGVDTSSDESGGQLRQIGSGRSSTDRSGSPASRDRSSAGDAKGRPRGPEPREDEPDADPESAARAICLRLLTTRARTRQELAQALQRKGIPDDAVSSVLERFDDVGLIDDGAFAEQWVRSRHAMRGLGRRALAVELRRKGVADDVAGEALAEIDTEAEERRAGELVERKLRSLRTDTDEQRAAAGRKLIGMLARKGYSGAIVYRIVREALAAHGAELDELASEPPADE